MNLKGFQRKLTQPARALARAVRRLFEFTPEQRRQIREIERAQRERMKDPAYMIAVTHSVREKARAVFDKKYNKTTQSNETD